MLCFRVFHVLLVLKVPNTKDTVRFKLDTQEITYTLDMFCATFKLPVETLENPFKKEAIQYPRFIKLMIADLMKKFPNIPQRIDEDYHSIKNDIPLVSVYTIGNVLVRGMLIPDEFLTKEICATDDFKEYEMVFVRVDVPMNQSLEPGSHKENSKHVDNDDDDEEKVDEMKDAKMGSLETRTEEMQTPIPTTPRSPRIILSLDKNITQKYIHLLGALRRMCRCQGYMIQNMERKIKEVFKITTDQPYGLDFMEQILVMRENDKPNSFSEADFKYLNKNDIEDLYYLRWNKKVNYHETKLMNSLILFIKSHVIWERVHDFQLGIESYQVKVNLTTPTLTFPGIKAYEPYSIVDKPNTGLIYLNNKDEKRVMYLLEIVKFYDATL
nr:hypothetical protein [Tanacetum cinerariifolium]